MENWKEIQLIEVKVLGKMGPQIFNRYGLPFKWKDLSQVHHQSIIIGNVEGLCFGVVNFKMTEVAKSFKFLEYIGKGDEWVCEVNQQIIGV